MSKEEPKAFHRRTEDSMTTRHIEQKTELLKTLTTTHIEQKLIHQQQQTGNSSALQNQGNASEVSPGSGAQQHGAGEKK